MTDLRKAAEMALEVMEYNRANGTPNMGAAIEALRQALAQPEQEPVAHLWECIGRWTAMVAHDGEDANLALPDWLVDAVKAATAPPKREWVGLTDAEVEAWRGNYDFFDSALVREVEAKLKEKNT